MVLDIEGETLSTRSFRCSDRAWAETGRQARIRGTTASEIVRQFVEYGLAHREEVYKWIEAQRAAQGNGGDDL